MRPWLFKAWRLDSRLRKWASDASVTSTQFVPPEVLANRRTCDGAFRSKLKAHRRGDDPVPSRAHTIKDGSADLKLMVDYGKHVRDQALLRG